MVHFFFILYILTKYLDLNDGLFLFRSILHTSHLSSLAEANKRFKAIRDQVIKDFQYDEYKLLDLLLNLSQLEFNVREIYRKMVDQKQSQWELLKKEAKERTLELSEVS